MTSEPQGVVRAARRSDLVQLADLRIRFLGEAAHLEPRLRLLADARQRTEQALPVWMGQEDRVLLVAEVGTGAAEDAGAEEDAAVAGYAMGVLNVWPPVFESQHVGEIVEVFLDPAHRGRGLGRALVDRLTEVLRSRGATVMRASVPIANEPACAQLRAAGYESLQRVLERRLTAQ